MIDFVSIRDAVEWLNDRTLEYNEGNPTVADKEWDEAYYWLVEQEKAFPDEVYKDSPTQSLIYEVVDYLEKVTHSHKMLSLDKTKDIEVIKKFCKTVKEDVIVMPKMDGLTVSLHYEGGNLVSAETRGNGEVGENIAHNAAVIWNIPLRINYKHPLTVDGEVVCLYEDFEKVGKDYANPRNYAVGSIRLLNSHDCAQRRLSFFAWDAIGDVYDLENEKIETLSAKLCMINYLGFTIVPWKLGFDDSVPEYFQSLCTIKSIPIDGLVVKYNTIAEYDEAGTTAHHPKGAIAYKFYDEEFETELLGIEWGMGKSGQLTPIGIFKPVEIYDTIVERANLHNVSIMFSKLHNPFVGQQIKVTKMNMIIPEVTWGENVAIEDIPEDKALRVPGLCPYCGSITKILVDPQKTLLICTNDKCGGRTVNIIEHYASKRGIEILGLGEKAIEALIEWGWLNDISDIYTLKEHRDEWIKKDGWGIASVDKILSNIEKSKNCELYKFLAAINIPGIGITTAKKMCEYITSYEDFKEKVKNKYNFIKWAGFSYETQKKILNYDYSVADKIYYNYLNVINPTKQEVKESPLNGKKIVITGKLNNFKSRDKAKEYFSSLGCTVTDTVTKSTYFLLNNDKESGTSKNKKAQQLGIPIYSEDEVFSMFSLDE